MWEEGRVREGKSDSFIIKNPFVRHIENASHSPLVPALLEISSSHLYTLTKSISMSKFKVENQRKRLPIIVNG